MPSLSSPDSRGTAFDIAISRREELLQELGTLPPRLSKSLTSIHDFDADALLTATSRPAAVLSMLMLGPALDGYPVLLASLLDRLDRYVRRAGKKFQRHKVFTLQFIYCQFQPGGCLHRLIQQAPELVTAICLSALTFDVGGIRLQFAKHHRQPSKAVATRKLADGRGKRPQRASDTVERRLTVTKSQALAVRHVLAGSSYFRGLPEAESTRLLDAVAEISRVSDPNLFKQMLNNEKIMCLSAQPDTHLLQATLMVAKNSHILRTFTVHQSWCEYTLEKSQQSVVVASANVSHAFDFSPADGSSRRFARCHAWVIDNIMLPFLEMWARMAGGDQSQRLCLAAARTARTYDLAACTTTTATSVTDASSDDSGVNKSRRPSLLSFAISDIRHSTNPIELKTQPARLSASRSFSSLSTSTEHVATFNSETPCPLLNAGNRNHCVQRARIPKDTAGLLSVCKMYNINAEEILLYRKNI